MKYICFIIVLITLTSCQEAGSNVEQEIKHTLAGLAEAEELQEAKAVQHYFAKDATFIDLTSNETLVGVESIVESILDVLKQQNPAHATWTTNSVKVKSATQADALGTISYKTESYAFKAEFERVADSWLIQTWTQFTLAPTPTENEHLKALNWLLGTWSNNDEDTKITYVNRWDKNKNFMTQTFTLTLLGQKELTGKQIIGWDPVEKKFFSWVTDSNGGFGTGSWIEEGNSWYISSTYKLSDAQLATATQILTKVNDQIYTFSSIGRDIDGDMQPSIGPFTFTKQTE